MGWQVQSLHFVAFPLDEQPVDLLPAWLKVFSVSPQSYQQTQGVPGGATATGPIGFGMVATLTAVPGRVEIVISTPGNDADEQPPTIENVAGAMSRLKIQAGKLMSELPSARLAMNINAMQVASSQDEANSIFAAETGLAGLVPPHGTDLQFQLNVPRAEENGLGMNRVCRWATVIAQKVTVHMVLGSVPRSAATTTFLSTLLIDVNTLLDGAVIPPSSAPSVIDALAREASTILEGGYARLTS